MTKTYPTHQDPNTWLYPEIEPYQTGTLSVSPTHTLYYEECGNPNGKPAVVIHGGPGAGFTPNDRRFFNPNLYRIILVDQRGSGKSTPAASLEDNTTWHLVADLEKLRTHLKIKKWLALGGSWGSTLALCYAIKHPEAITELVLRGIFLLRKKEIDWYYQYGASAMYPDVWEQFRDHIPENERGDFVKAYHQRLTSKDLATQMAAAVPWTTWEMATSKLYTSPEAIKASVTDEFAYKFARIECHYFMNNGFLETDNWIIENIGGIRHIPTVIVQGRYDVVCPPMSAWELHRAWPEAKLFLNPDAGHSRLEPANARALIAATNEFASKGFSN